MVSFVIRNFSRSLGIWWYKKASTTHMGYKFRIVIDKSVSDDGGEFNYYEGRNYNLYSQPITQNSDYFETYEIFNWFYDQPEPYFDYFDGEVKSVFSKKKNWFSNELLSTEVIVDLDYDMSILNNM